MGREESGQVRGRLDKDLLIGKGAGWGRREHLEFCFGCVMVKALGQHPRVNRRGVGCKSLEFWKGARLGIPPLILTLRQKHIYMVTGFSHPMFIHKDIS